MTKTHPITGTALASLAGTALVAATLLAGCTSSNNAGPGMGSAGATATGAAGSPAGVSGAPAIAAAGAASGGAPAAAAGSASGGADQGAEGVQCGTGFCAPPMSCCRPTGSTTTPSCVVACDDSQEQLCSGNADCQGSDSAECIKGVCTDVPSDAGPSDAAPVDSGPINFFDGGPTNMNVPDGYPAPTAANYAKCQKVPVSDKACAGDPSGNVCIECLFGGSNYNSALTPDSAGTAAAGNYLVTVQLGGAAAAKTTISAESQRGLLASTDTAAGASTTFAFAVNVRAMEGQPDHAGGPGGYPGLDLFFSGPASSPPQVSAVGYALATTAQRPINLFIASDSTSCDQTGGVYGGWGQMISQFFAPPIAVANYANSGASSSSFLGGSGLWSGITSHWKAGDYVFIQFGHNDKDVSDAVVQTNLEKYVTQAKAASVTPIIVSPPARVSFSGSMETDQSSLHAAAAKKAAADQNVAYIDLTALSTAWYNSLGSKALAMTFHAAGTDATHTNLPGAAKIASLVAGSIQSQKLPLAKYLR